MLSIVADFIEFINYIVSVYKQHLNSKLYTSKLLPSQKQPSRRKGSSRRERAKDCYTGKDEQNFNFGHQQFIDNFIYLFL